MTKDNKPIIYTAVGVTVLAAILPSEGAVWLSTDLMCGPPPLQMADMSEDGPHAPLHNEHLVTRAAFTGSTSSVWLGPQFVVV